jgi:hypothetical protein
MAMLDIAHKLFIEGKTISDIKTVPHFGDVKLVGKAIYFHAEATVRGKC